MRIFFADFAELIGAFHASEIPLISGNDDIVGDFADTSDVPLQVTLGDIVKGACISVVWHELLLTNQSLQSLHHGLYITRYSEIGAHV